MTDMTQEYNGKIKILALFGKSAAGKDTIQKWMVSNLPNTHGIVSYTTRPPREGEVGGIDYIFATDEDFDKATMLEQTEFRGWRYGTGLLSLDISLINIGVFNVAGVRSLLLNPNLEVLPVWVQAPDKTRLLRSLARESAPNCEEICRRFLADESDFRDIDFHYVAYDNCSNQDYFNVHKIEEVNKFLHSNDQLFESLAKLK